MAKKQSFPVKETILEYLKEKKKATFDELVEYLEQKGYGIKGNAYRKRALKGLLTRLVAMGVLEKEGDSDVYVYKQ